MDDRYEYATLQLISPETRTEPVIVPWGVYLHTHGFNANAEAIGRYFDNDMVAVEAHGSLEWDGTFRQFQYLDRQADAQMAANGFMRGGKLHGGISVESEDNGDPRQPWSRQQMLWGGMFLANMHKRYGLELRMMTAPRQNAVGYHAQFPENAGGHACPGRVRVAQIPEMIEIAKWWVGLGQEPDLTEVVDELRYPTGEHWQLQRDGGVVTVAGGKFWGSYPGLGHAAQVGGARRFGHFEPRADGGYNLIATHPVATGERYQFPAH